MNSFLNSEIIVHNIAVVCFVKSGTGQNVHSNRPTHGIALHLGGEKKYCFDGNSIYTVRKNDIIFLPKGTNYTITTTDEKNGDCYAINFEVADDKAYSPFVIRSKNSPLYMDAFKNANTTWLKKEFGYQTLCMSELYRILYQMRKEYGSEYVPGEKSALLLPAIQFIHNEYMHGKTDVPYLAELCGIGQTYFRKIFHSTYGMSPVQYINNLKFERAMELIKTNMYSVSEIVLLSGFENESYFSRSFKKRYGASPKSFLRKL